MSSVSVFIFKPCVCLFLNVVYFYTLEKGWEVRGAPYNNLYGEFLPNRVHLSIQERLFHVLFFLSTFAKQLAKLKRKALKLVKLPSFESDLLKSDDDIGAQTRAKFYRSRPFVWLVPDTKFIDIELHFQFC